jgi:hypothetical protein
MAGGRAGSGGGGGTTTAPPTDARTAGGAGTGGVVDARATGDGPAPGDAAGLPMTGVDCKGARLCDDFEAYTVGGVPAGGWGVSVSKGTGTVTVDGTKAWSGTKSALFKTTGGIAHALITRGKPLLPIPGNAIYGRMMLFMTASPPGAVHWNNVNFYGRLPTGQRAQYGYGGMYQRMWATYNPHDCYQQSRMNFPTARWVCMQWLFDGSADANGVQKNEAHLWMDGKEITDVAVIKVAKNCVDGTKSEWIAPNPFDSMTLGWENYQSSTIPLEMWVDDLAINDKAIACPAPMMK